jgi:ankyrin repeat protein
MKKQKKPNADQMIAAINRRDIELLRKLLADGADPNTVKDFISPHNVTMLSYAAGCQFLEGVELLLQSGADINIVTTPGVTGEGGGGTALHEAINGADIRTSADDVPKRLKIVDLLLSSGADPNAICDKNRLPLYGAACSGYFEICQRLIEAGALVENLPEGCISPLFGVVYNCPEAHNREMVVNLLIQTDCDTTPLMAAAYRGRESLVNLFLERGANVNRQAKCDGRTPLICAALYFRWDADDEERQQTTLRIVKRLLESGADPQARNNKDESAFDIASHGKSSLVADYIKSFSK